jgi:hypothetical protein
MKVHIEHAASIRESCKRFCVRHVDHAILCLNESYIFRFLDIYQLLLGTAHFLRPLLFSGALQRRFFFGKLSTKLSQKV